MENFRKGQVIDKKDGKIVAILSDLVDGKYTIQDNKHPETVRKVTHEFLEAQFDGWIIE